MTRKILLYNHRGCENRGCEAIVRSTVALLCGEGTSMQLATGQPAYDRALQIPYVKIIPDVISPYSLDRIVNSIGFRLGMPREHEVARRYAPILRAGKRSDLCLSIGGDTYCYGPQEHMRVINNRLMRQGIPLVLWGCSINPDLLQGDLLQEIRQYDLIVARENITREALEEHGIHAKYFRDPAFSLKEERLPLCGGFSKEETIGLNISPLVLDHMGERKKGLNLFAEWIRHVLHTTKANVALFSHVTWSHDDDRTICAALKGQFPDEPRVFVLPDGLNACQIKGYISRMCLLVTARTHASIAGYSMGIPTLVIGYSVKARGIARDLFGQEKDHVIPSKELGEASLLIRAFEALAERAREEKKFLQERMPQYLQDCENVVPSVLNRLESGGRV